MSGATEVFMKETGIAIKYKGMERTNGQMEESFPENGSKIRCMERGHTRGRMGGATKALTRMTSSTAVERTNGQMGKFIKASGSMENSMDEVSLSPIMALKDQACGKMANVFNGLTKKTHGSSELIIATLIITFLNYFT